MLPDWTGGEQRMRKIMGIIKEQDLILGHDPPFIDIAHFKGKQCQLCRMSLLFLPSAELLPQGDIKDHER